MAWTQSDIDAMKAAIARGVRRVTFADQTTEYHSLDEMRRALAQMEREVNAPRSHRLAASSKGV